MRPQDVGPGPAVHDQRDGVGDRDPGPLDYGGLVGDGGVEFEALESTLTPMERRLDANEIAQVALFLAGREAGGITGQAWNVDAGTVLS